MISKSMIKISEEDFCTFPFIKNFENILRGVQNIQQILQTINLPTNQRKILRRPIIDLDTNTLILTFMYKLLNMLPLFVGEQILCKCSISFYKFCNLFSTQFQMQ